ncbi:MAG: hypothetical protein K1X54_07060 [Flavobacteriales bacterium]|nr:hypothetical protein [Flavobacteriales bacterium]
MKFVKMTITQERTTFDPHPFRYMRNIILLTIILLGISHSVFSQNDSLKSALGKLGKSPVEGAIKSETPNQNVGTPGKVDVKADSSIVNLEKGSRKFKETKGYRIQIFLGSVDQAKVERNKYLSLGLPYSIYSKQIVPEQALQIGDFINRMEMEKHLKIIEKHYPKAFGVVSFIEPPKFSQVKR